MYENVNFHFLFQLDWIIPFYSYVICFDLNSVFVASSGGSFETENQQALPQSIEWFITLSEVIVYGAPKLYNIGSARRRLSAPVLVCTLLTPD